MTSPIHTSRNGAILEVTIDRPKANAIDAATSRIMGDVFASFRDDPELRVAILTSTGEKFFCPGWDLKAAANGEAPDSDYGVGGFGGLQELPGLNKPVICAVNARLAISIMTSLAFIFGVVPLVIGEGAGAEMRRTLEDDGWLITLVHDVPADRAELVVAAALGGHHDRQVPAIRVWLGCGGGAVGDGGVADDAELDVALEDFGERLGARFHQGVARGHAVALGSARCRRARGVLGTARA